MRNLFIIYFFHIIFSHRIILCNEITKNSLDFLRLPSSPRTISLGGLNVGDRNNINIFSNPQSINYQSKNMISFSSTLLYDDIKSRWFIFSFPLNSSSFAFGFNYLDYGKIHTIDYSNIDSGIINPRDLLILLGYGYKSKKIEIAANVKYIDSKLSKKATTFSLDTSININLNKNLETCLNINNLGKKIKYNTEKEPLPLLLSIGFWYRSNYLSIGYQYFNNFYSNNSYSIGIEKEIEVNQNKISLRLGYNSLLKNISNSKTISLGFGFESSNYVFNYSFVPSDTIGNTNSFSISVKF